MWLLRYQIFIGKSSLLVSYTSTADSIHILKSGSSPPRVLLSRAGKLHLCRHSQLLRAQLGHRRSLAHWRPQRSELKNYSRFHFPALCPFGCLQRQARPVRRRGGGGNTESISIQKGGLENRTMEKCGWVDACMRLSEPTASVVWWLLVSIQ